MRLSLLLVVMGACALLAVELLSRLNLRHERVARRYLGDRLFTRELGAGTPVVFIPGYQGSTEFWGEAFDGLADRHHLIFVDALGFGRSPWPVEAPTLDDHLGALHRTLIASGATTRIALVGHSFGTLLAAYYADRYPEGVERVLLIGSPVFNGEEDARKRVHEISSFASLMVRHRTVARAMCMIMCAFRPLLAKVLPYLGRDLPPGVARDALLHSWPSADGAFRNILLTRPLALPLERIGSKVTLLHGAADRVTSLSRIHELAEATGARVIETADRHLSYIARSSDAIATWIETSQPPPSSPSLWRVSAGGRNPGTVLR